jgi:hypothetical protein
LVNRHRCYGGYGGIVLDKNKVYPILVHLVSGDFAGGANEGWHSSGCGLHGVVDVVQSMCVTGLVLQVSDRFKGSITTTFALGRWSLVARVRRLPDCHQQWQADSGKGAARAASRRLALAAEVVVRWSKDLNVIFIMFVMLLYLL